MMQPRFGVVGYPALSARRGLFWSVDLGAVTLRAFSPEERKATRGRKGSNHGVFHFGGAVKFSDQSELAPTSGCGGCLIGGRRSSLCFDVRLLSDNPPGCFG